MRISSSVGLAIAAAATTDFAWRGPFLATPAFFVLADARRGFTFSMLA
jgi:hypothetical protein